MTIFLIIAIICGLIKKIYGPYMVLRPFFDERVMSKVKAILKEVGFTGIFSVVFLIDQDDNLYFLEVNFRNSTWSYAYTRGGYNMPYLWAKATLGKIRFVAYQTIRGVYGDGRTSRHDSQCDRNTSSVFLPVVERFQTV